MLDGVNIEEYKLDALRSRIGVVLQDVFLFSGSVMENITLRNPDITEDQVIEAAKLIGVHDFIMQLPGGYYFNVMEAWQYTKPWAAAAIILYKGFII